MEGPEKAVEDHADDALIVRVSAARLGETPRGARADRAQDPRTRRTRAAIVEAATTLFLQHGYQGTSTDDIAGLAAVSKRTVYSNFGDKERLFTEIILGITVTAERFADLAREYYRNAPGRVLSSLGVALGSLAERGALVVPDPQRAAEHFAFLVLGATLDRAMFEGEQSVPSNPELQRTADDATRAFLAAYSAH